MTVTAAETIEERYRAIVTGAVVDAIERMRRNIDLVSGGNPSTRALADKTADYLHWLSWTTWDLPQLAVVIQPDEERFRADLSASVLIYFAGRLLDDYLDRHFLYRGRRETLLATLAREGGGPEAESLTVVMALLLCFEGLQHARAGAQTAAIIDAARALLAGILMERSPREDWSPEFYERLVELKNVEYWRILYAALDPELQSPLYPFLRRYYALAQKVNDLQDRERDAEQSRPNIAAIFGDDVRSVIGKDVAALQEMADALDDSARAIALAKLDETKAEIESLFTPAPLPDPAEALHLFWHSNSNDFRDRLGDDAFETVDCPVCGARNDATIFRKHRFDYHRCATCAHIYVSPRVKPEVQKRLGEELDASEDGFLQTQKIYADYLCRLLRKHAPGPRLLDIGYGSGYLLRTARAHGFQVYGVETSRARTAELDAMFGSHLAVAHLGSDLLPWGSFDAIVMTHVLEHLGDPNAALRQIAQALNPGGVLYLAVPDSESWQFRIFGKEWDAVNPVAHYQFFNERSLTRALREAGFPNPARMRMPPLQGALRQKWTTLFRSLGGDESGELAMLARLT
ncbi:MAG TPA: methyltransferase domain-containing protein [Thermoanaerobaculia bacterium]|nr:methyltransferase domain-containing protein [Thermoanaerobaculia bacterium]